MLIASCKILIKKILSKTQKILKTYLISAISMKMINYSLIKIKKLLVNIILKHLQIFGLMNLFVEQVKCMLIDVKMIVEIN